MILTKASNRIQELGSWPISEGFSGGVGDFVMRNGAFVSGGEVIMPVGASAYVFTGLQGRGKRITVQMKTSVPAANEDSVVDFLFADDLDSAAGYGIVAASVDLEGGTFRGIITNESGNNIGGYNFANGYASFYKSYRLDITPTNVQMRIDGALIKDVVNTSYSAFNYIILFNDGDDTVRVTSVVTQDI